jgi:hypothetical protein
MTLCPESGTRPRLRRPDTGGRRLDSDGVIVLLTVFRKTRQHDQQQIDRAVQARSGLRA